MMQLISPPGKITLCSYPKLRLTPNASFTQEMDGDAKWRISDSAEWKAEIAQRGFFGGTAKVYLWVPGNSDTPSTEPIASFRVGGKNPDQATARAYIDARGGTGYPYLYALARHETSGRVRENGKIRFYNQFYTDYKNGPIGTRAGDMGWVCWAEGWPLYNLDRKTTNSGRVQNGPGGYGMYQLTLGPKLPATNVPTGSEQFISRRQIWNWQDNVSGAVTELQGKRAQAVALRDGLAATYPQWPALPNEGGLSGLDAIVVTLYNGMGGLPKKKIGDIEKRTPWMPKQVGATRTWRFYQNSRNYVHFINLQINTTKP